MTCLTHKEDLVPEEIVFSPIEFRIIHYKLPIDDEWHHCGPGISGKSFVKSWVQPTQQCLMH